jgi:peptidoglycan biosynthesis protein MviN/MurJ (putative lipid II flippase)
VAFNIVLKLALYAPLGASGLALATAAGAWVNFGLLVILAAFVAIVPALGFVVSIGLFVAAVAYYAGARDAKTLLWCALITGPMLWLSFDFALEIHLPTGMWSQWIGK